MHIKVWKHIYQIIVSFGWKTELYKTLNIFVVECFLIKMFFIVNKNNKYKYFRFGEKQITFFTNGPCSLEHSRMLENGASHLLNQLNLCAYVFTSVSTFKGIEQYLFVTFIVFFFSPESGMAYMLLF